MESRMINSYPQGGATNSTKVLGIDGNNNTILIDTNEIESVNGFEGKIVSILGDSISTFAGYTPVADGHNLQHRNRYPQDNLITNVEETWWWKLINGLGAQLGINDSWAGSQVSNDLADNSGDLGPDACMASNTRITNLGSNGTPDLILFYGGTNDCGRSVTLGTFDSTTTHSLDLVSTTWASFADAYACAIMRLQHYYPNAKLIVLLPTYTTGYYTLARLDSYNEVVKEICDYFGVPVLDLRQCGINWANVGTTLGDGIHPVASGMDLMCRYIRQRLLSMYSCEIGTVERYPITTHLTQVNSSNGYYVSVRANESYTTALTVDYGVIDSVTVTMGGVDITSDVYDSQTKIITISAVTGAVVITATSAATVTVYRGQVVIDHPEYFTNSIVAGSRGWAYVDNPIGVPINAIWFNTETAVTNGVVTVGVADVNTATLKRSQTATYNKIGTDKELIQVVFDEAYTLTENEVFIFFCQDSINFNVLYSMGQFVVTETQYNRVPQIYGSGSQSWGEYGSGVHTGVAIGYVQ